ncbi:MAG TPA: flavodoxin [candidate division Zixibacteria bacterium]|nr:flavodoxin [candidate division Zixibacteria bacterium]
MKILVLYYSKTGNTKFIAEAIAQETKADLLEIKREKDIKSIGFWLYFRGGFESMTKKKDKIKPFDKNLEEYDLIFLGSPVWAWRVNPAIRSLLNEITFINKKFGLFCCCFGEGNGLKVCEHTKELLTGNVVLGEAEFIDPLNVNPIGEATKARLWANDILTKAKK